MQNVIYHFSQKRISRAEGRSVTSAAAYRAGEKIFCEYEGRLHDYSHRTKKGDIGDTLLILPNGKDITSQRADFWNSVEQHHRRKDANLAWEFELALPNLLTVEQNRQLVQDYAKELTARYGTAVDVCIHRSHDGKNPHAHVMLSACQIKPDDTLGLKCNELDPIWCGQQRRKKPNLKKPSDVERPRWAELVNNALASAGHDARTDHRTLAAQGINREPQRHNPMPNSDAAKEIAAHNAQALADMGEIARLDARITDEEQELAALKAERDIETTRLQKLFADMQLEDARKAAALEERQARAQSDGEKLSAGFAQLNKLGSLADISRSFGLFPPPPKPKQVDLEPERKQEAPEKKNNDSTRFEM
jgi:ATP-dependent exoDNAse (exonuclease V) alpha subunit